METIQKKDTKAIFENWVNAYSDALFSWAFYKNIFQRKR